MVQALINISDRTNRVINIVKAKYGLKDKSEAINVLVSEYEKELLEPELRPEFIKRMEGRQKEKTLKVSSFKKR